MYIDESGDTSPLSQGGSTFFVLSGCIVDESNAQGIDSKLRGIKKEFYQDPEVEFKSNFVRYANPDLSEKSPLKLKARDKYDQLETRLAEFLKNLPIELITVVIDKTGYWERYPSQNPYEVAYAFLLERFQLYLAQADKLGICIIDPREGKVEKHYYGAELHQLHERMRRSGRTDGNVFWNKCPNVIEKLLFSQSDQTVGIQVADLFCYPVFHVYEYDKSARDYWRFNDLTMPKFFRRDGKLEGIGLKYFPGENKKALS